MGNKLYLISGRAANDTLVTTEYEYDPSSDSWSSKTAMITGREEVGSAVVDGKIYVFGGINKSGAVISTLEVYEPSTDSWDDTVTDMPAPKILGDFGVVYNGKIYALRGANSFANYRPMSMDDPVYEYDPSTDRWDSSRMAGPAPKSYKEVGVVGSNLYVVGGNRITAGKPTWSSWKYGVDTKESSFIGLAPNSAVLSAARAVAYDGSIHVSGGNRGGAAINELWRLDP